MTRSGYQDTVIRNLLAITLYVPLIIAIIASSVKLYDFIYPAIRQAELMYMNRHPN